MSSKSEEFPNLTPEELLETANNEALNLLPVKSRKTYEQKYQSFLKWQQTKNTTSVSENVMLAYFSELSFYLIYRRKSIVCNSHKMAIFALM